MIPKEDDTVKIGTVHRSRVWKVLALEWEVNFIGSNLPFSVRKICFLGIYLLRWKQRWLSVPTLFLSFKNNSLYSRLFSLLTSLDGKIKILSSACDRISAVSLTSVEYIAYCAVYLLTRRSVPPLWQLISEWKQILSNYAHESDEDEALPPLFRYLFKIYHTAGGYFRSASFHFIYLSNMRVYAQWRWARELTIRVT